MVYMVLGVLLFGALLLTGGLMFHSIALFVAGVVVIVALGSFFAQLALR